jgi:hypothetical protein
MLPIVELIRLEENHNYGTFGVLRINKEVFCFTLEPPDHLNTRGISSIPAQQYLCSKKASPRFGETYEIRHVPGRADVLFHAGNRVSDTEGCVILAQHQGKLRGDRAVLNSGATFRAFMDAMRDHQTFHLTIVEHY